jgi:acyl carrier protein
VEVRQRTLRPSGSHDDVQAMTLLETDPIGRDVLTVLHRVCRRPVELAANSSLAADLGFDSLQTLEFVAELEDRFGITVPIDQMPRIHTVGEAVKCVRSLVAENVRP